MKKIYIIALFLPSLAFGQAQPSYDQNRLRYAVYEVIKQEAIRQGIPANDPRIDQTAKSIGDRFKDAANNPQYQQTATRWALILFRIMNKANPYLSLALEFCRAVSCVPSPKTTITSVPKKDAVTTRYQYDLNMPLPVIGSIYFNGKTVPKADFSCGGTDAFIANAEYYFPGDGTPCRVRMGIPSALSAFGQYLDTNYDYFGIESGDLVPWYAQNPKPSMVQLPDQAAIVCTSKGNTPTSSTSFQILSQNPYYPCISKPLTGDPYSLAPGQPYTFEPWVLTPATPRVYLPFVTDFDMASIGGYPDAPPRGQISFDPWADTLTTPDKSPQLAPAVIKRLIELTWPDAAISPGYLGLPWPAGGIPDTVFNPLPDTFTDWPLIGDLLDLNPSLDWVPAPKNKPKPDLKKYSFLWNCGWGNFPACIFDFVASPSTPDIQDVDFKENPFNDSPIVNAPTPDKFLTYLNARFVGSVCSPFNVNKNIQGRVISVNYDFCGFANVAKDVIAIFAYIMTAGYILSLFNTRRQNV